MAVYYSPIVIQQNIPLSDMTSLELLCLSNMFETDELDEKLYFYASKGVEDVISLDYGELSAVLAEPENAAYAELEEFRAPYTPFPIGSDNSRIMIDLSMLSWEFFVQNIVKRSASLTYVSAMIAYCCAKMRPDGFGGMAVLITAETITVKDTSDMLEEMLEEAGITAE